MENLGSNRSQNVEPDLPSVSLGKLGVLGEELQIRMEAALLGLANRGAWVKACVPAIAAMGVA